MRVTFPNKRFSKKTRHVTSVALAIFMAANYFFTFIPTIQNAFAQGEETPPVTETTITEPAAEETPVQPTEDTTAPAEEVVLVEEPTEPAITASPEVGPITIIPTTADFDPYVRANGASGFSIRAVVSDPDIDTDSCEYTLNYVGDGTETWEKAEYRPTIRSCQAAIIGIADNTPLSINIRVSNLTGEIGIGKPITRIADADKPYANIIKIEPDYLSKYTSAAPHIFAVFTDDASPITSCQFRYRVADGRDYPEWSEATWTPSPGGKTGGCQVALLDLADGTKYNFQMRAQDSIILDGHWSNAITVTRTIDSGVPTSFFTSPAKGSYWNTAIPLSGYSTDGLTKVTEVNLYYYTNDPLETTLIARITEDTEPASPQFDWSYSWTPTAEGTYNLMAKATDAVGNLEDTAYVLGVTYDITAPTATWTEPTGTGALDCTTETGNRCFSNHQNAKTLQIHAEDVSGVASVSFQFIDKRSSTVYTINPTVDLGSGDYNTAFWRTSADPLNNWPDLAGYNMDTALQAVVTDILGNTTIVPIDVKIDNYMPELTLNKTVVANQYTSGDSLRLVGTVYDPTLVDTGSGTSRLFYAILDSAGNYVPGARYGVHSPIPNGTGAPLPLDVNLDLSSLPLTDGIYWIVVFVNDYSYRQGPGFDFPLNYQEGAAYCGTVATPCVDINGNAPAFSDYRELVYPFVVDKTPPDQPLFWVEEDSSQILVAWKPIVDAVSYNIYRDSGLAPVANVAVSLGTYLTWTNNISGAHTYEVTALDAAGNESPRLTTPAAMKYAETFDLVIDDNAWTDDFNSNGNVSHTGEWFNYSVFYGDPNYADLVLQNAVGGDSHSTYAVNGQTYTWKTNSTLSGAYEVFVTAICDPSRPIVNYDVYSGKTKLNSEPIAIDQSCFTAQPTYSVYGPEWVSIGTYFFNAKASVTLSATSGTFAIADAVAFEQESVIQGRKFSDNDDNGRNDVNTGADSYIDGWNIYLYNTRWQQIDSMTTGDDTTPAGKVTDGQYRFIDLEAGTYYVCEEARTGWEQTRPNRQPWIQYAGDESGIADKCFNITLSQGEYRKGVQFGNHDVKAPIISTIKDQILDEGQTVNLDLLNGLGMWDTEGNLDRAFVTVSYIDNYGTNSVILYQSPKIGDDISEAGCGFDGCGKGGTLNQLYEYYTGDPIDFSTIDVIADTMILPEGKFTFDYQIADKAGNYSDCNLDTPEADQCSFTITINNVAPLVTLSSDQTINEGAYANFETSFSDPSTNHMSSTIDPILTKMNISLKEVNRLAELVHDDAPWTIEVDYDYDGTTFNTDEVIGAYNEPPTADVAFNHLYGYVTGTKSYTVAVRACEAPQTEPYDPFYSEGECTTAENIKTVVVTIKNLVPTVTITPTNPEITTAQSVVLSASVNGGNPGYTYSWSCTNGLTGTGSTINFTNSTTGQFTCSITVKDTDGDTASAQTIVRVGAVQGAITEPPEDDEQDGGTGNDEEVVLAVTVTPENPEITTDEEVILTANATGGVGPYTYAWTCTNGLTGTDGTLTFKNATAGEFTCTVKVTDSQGKTSESTSSIKVGEVKGDEDENDGSVKGDTDNKTAENRVCFWWWLLGIVALVLNIGFVAVSREKLEDQKWRFAIPVVIGLVAFLLDKLMHTWWTPSQYCSWMWIIALITVILPMALWFVIRPKKA